MSEIVKDRLVFGLDLGQTSDPSALSAIKRQPSRLEGESTSYRGLIHQLDIVHLERYPLGTSYPNIVSQVAGRLSKLPEGTQRPLMAVDATGVGRAVVDLFIDAKLPVDLYPVTITAGNQARKDKWNETSFIAYWVPKIDLVSIIQAGLGTGLLKVVPGLPLAELLRSELVNFRMKVSKHANEIFNAREGAHDDLVLSVAMAAWLAEHVEIGAMWTPKGGLAAVDETTDPSLRRDPRVYGRFGTVVHEDEWNRR